MVWGRCGVEGVCAEEANDPSVVTKSLRSTAKTSLRDCVLTGPKLYLGGQQTHSRRIKSQSLVTPKPTLLSSPSPKK